MFRLDLGFGIFRFESLDFAVWIWVFGSSLRWFAQIVDFVFLDFWSFDFWMNSDFAISIFDLGYPLIQ